MTPMKSGLYTVAKDFTSANGAAIESNVKAMVDAARATVDGKAIEDHIRGFVESSKVLMSALDEVAKIHPFIGSKCTQLHKSHLS